MQLYRYFVSQSSEFCRHNPLCCFSTSVYCCKLIFRYRLSPETFESTLVCNRIVSRKLWAINVYIENTRDFGRVAQLLEGGSYKRQSSEAFGCSDALKADSPDNSNILTKLSEIQRLV
jgi:hypothetical protein